MIKDLTIFFPYYNQDKALEFQLSNISNFSQEILKKINVLIVDDGSQDKPAFEIIQKYIDKINITLYRINVDIKWNQPEASNIALENTKTDYMFRTDIDSFFDSENIEKLFTLNLDEEQVYQLHRKSYYNKTYIKNIHRNTFIFSRKIYSKIRYNEYFSGNYGQDDNDLYYRLQQNYKISILDKEKIFYYVNSTEYSTKNLTRDTETNKKKLLEKNKPFITFANKENYLLLITNSRIIKNVEC